VRSAAEHYPISRLRIGSIISRRASPSNHSSGIPFSVKAPRGNEGIYSKDMQYTKPIVETPAQTPGQMPTAVVALNE